MQGDQTRADGTVTPGVPENIVLEGDRISMDFDGVRLVGQIVQHCAHDITVRLISPIAPPVTTGCHIMLIAPLKHMSYHLLDERGNPLPELSPFGMKRAADLVAELWVANRVAVEHREQLQAVHQTVAEALFQLEEQTRTEKAERLALRKALREGRLTQAEYQKSLAARKKQTEKLQKDYWDECSRVQEQLAPILPPDIHAARVMECFEAMELDKPE